MNTLASFYKIFADIDLARNDLFNVSRIIGNQYSSLGKDLEITTWDSKSTVKSGDLVLHAGVGSNSNYSGKVFLFAGSEVLTDNGVFEEDTVFANAKYTTSDSKVLYRGIQLNPDTSISLLSDNSTTGFINIVGNTYARLISGLTSVKLTAATNTLEAINKNSTTAGHMVLQTNDFDMTADDADFAYLTFTSLVGTNSVATADYYLTVEDEDGVLTSREGLDYITVRKLLHMTSGSVLDFDGSEVDVDATTSISLDSPAISIGKDATTVNSSLYIYSAANGFKLDAASGDSKIQVNDVDVNDDLKVYGTITLGQSTTGDIANNNEVNVMRKLTVTSPSYDIKNSNASESILVGTGPTDTYLKVNKADVHTLLTSEKELIALEKATLTGEITINNSDTTGAVNKTSVYSKHILIDNHTSATPSAKPSTGLIEVSTDYLGVESDYLTASIISGEYVGSDLAATLSTDLDITATSSYAVRAGLNSSNPNIYSYSVSVREVDDVYRSDLKVDGIDVSDTINTARLIATDYVDTDSLIVGDMIIYWDSSNSSVVFAKR